MFPNISTKKKFFEKNKTYWLSDEKAECCSDKYIVVAHTIPFHFEFNVLLDIIAKGLNNKKSLPVYAFSIGEVFDSFVEGDASFGIKADYYDFTEYEKEEHYKEINSCMDFLYSNSSKNFLEYTYRDIHCGDAIWDTLICCSEDFDVTHVDCGMARSIIQSAFSIIDLAFEIFEKFPPAYLITDESVRLEGLFAGVASYYGSNIVITNLDMADSPVLLKFDNGIMAGYLTEYYKKIINDKHDKCEEEQFLWPIEERKTNEIRTMIDTSKPCAFVMMHVLDDVPRFACKHKIYDDYTQWVRDTFEIIKNIENVNWIIRDHPHATGKHQRKYLKELFEKNKSDNMFWCDDLLCRQDILEIVEYVITYSGDVGIEYWMHGIPTVTLTETYYSDRGISHRVKNRDEYVKVLNNLDKLSKPSKESIHSARECISAIKERMTTKDSLSSLFREIHKKEMMGIKYEDRKYDLYDYEFISKYLKMIENDLIKKSECYRLTNMVEM